MQTCRHGVTRVICSGCTRCVPWTVRRVMEGRSITGTRRMGTEEHIPARRLQAAASVCPIPHSQSNPMTQPWPHPSPSGRACTLNMRHFPIRMGCDCLFHYRSAPSTLCCFAFLAGRCASFLICHGTIPFHFYSLCAFYFDPRETTTVPLSCRPQTLHPAAARLRKR
jgi:hypothetical protein